jgi:hypothetical protein
MLISIFAETNFAYKPAVFKLVQQTGFSSHRGNSSKYLILTTGEQFSQMGFYGFIFSTYPSQHMDRKRGSGHKNLSKAGYRSPQHHLSRSEIHESRLDAGFHGQRRAAPPEYVRSHGSRSRSRSRTQVRNHTRNRPLTPRMQDARRVKSREKAFEMHANKPRRSRYTYSLDQRKENTNGRRHRPNIYDSLPRTRDRVKGYDQMPSSKPSKEYRTAKNGAYRAYGPETRQTSAPFHNRYKENVSSSYGNARQYSSKPHGRFARYEGPSRNTEGARERKGPTWVRPPNARHDDAIMYAPRGTMRLNDEKKLKFQKRVRFAA